MYTETLDTRTFEPNKQTWRLFREQALRLVFTALLVAGTIVALRLYERQDTVAHSQKNSFNVVITILNLALGLNFLVGIKSVFISKSSSYQDGTIGSIQGYGKSPPLEGTCESAIQHTTDRSHIGR